MPPKFRGGVVASAPFGGLVGGPRGVSFSGRFTSQETAEIVHLSGLWRRGRFRNHHQAINAVEVARVVRHERHVELERSRGDPRVGERDGSTGTPEPGDHDGPLSTESLLWIDHLV